MPEHQQQQAAVAGPVAAAFGGVDQLFHLEAGEVLAPAVLFLPAARRARFSCFPSVHRFVESLPCRRPRKPLQTGRWRFRVSTKCSILSRVAKGAVRKEAGLFNSGSTLVVAFTKLRLWSGEAALAPETLKVVKIFLKFMRNK